MQGPGSPVISSDLHACRALTSTLDNVSAIAKPSTRQLFTQDAELDRHRELLRSQQERDERRSAADKQALDRLKRAYAASKAADTPTGAAATIKAAAKEMKALDICRVFEAERSNLAETAAAAEADVAVAWAALQQAQVGCSLGSKGGDQSSVLGSCAATWHHRLTQCMRQAGIHSGLPTCELMSLLPTCRKRCTQLACQASTLRRLRGRRG